jgi:hypothetical protein
MKDPARKRKPPRDPGRPTDRSFKWYRGHAHAFEFCPRPEFFELADAAVEARRTRFAYDRLYVLWQAVRTVANVSGAAAEVGSFRGGSAFFIASAFARLSGDEVPFHIFDTFEGHPGEAVTGADFAAATGQFSETSYEDVRDYLSPFRQVQIHRGDVLNTLAGLPETTYRFAHLDTDLYLPTLRCLEYFGARLADGGVVVVDDYASRKSPGVAKGVSEYLGQTDRFHAWDTRTEQLVLLKR